MRFSLKVLLFASSKFVIWDDIPDNSVFLPTKKSYFKLLLLLLQISKKNKTGRKKEFYELKKYALPLKSSGVLSANA